MYFSTLLQTRSFPSRSVGNRLLRVHSSTPPIRSRRMGTRLGIWLQLKEASFPFGTSFHIPFYFQNLLKPFVFITTTTCLLPLHNLPSSVSRFSNNLQEKMPRSRGGAGPSRSAPSRPTAPAATPRTAAPQQQQRPYSSTAAAPAQQAAHPPAAQTSQGPGLFGQMASTAA